MTKAEVYWECQIESSASHSLEDSKLIPWESLEQPGKRTNKVRLIKNNPELILF